ncbi:carbohydrate ABC transporter permease [Microbacterium sp. bgisy207]|jgi:multiple sugar transport system permease protein/putative chitobiose transport system permease protein|uniref:carbohydrate ABC transporter permease n=1 Tax=Microbacterium sp. bgisy207 TaxID=3413800 RepID=UPI003EC09428
MSLDASTARERRYGRWLLIAVLPIVLVSLLPLFYTIISSFRPGSEIFQFLSPLSINTFWPQEITLDNYTTLLSGDFLRALLNSVIVTSLTVVLGLAVASLAAFGLAVFDFPFKNTLFVVLVLSFLIPFEAVAIPLSSMFRDWGLANTYVGLILPGLGNGLAIFLLRQFFLGIPPSLAEAARIDGASWLRVFWTIYLPLSRPSLVGAGLILFVFQWQSFLWPLVIAPSPDMKVSPIAIADLAGEAEIDFGAMFAGAILTALLPLLILLVFQRQFTASLASSGTKE